MKKWLLLGIVLLIVITGCGSRSSEAKEYLESVGQALDEAGDEMTVCYPVHPSEEPDCRDIFDNDLALALSLEYLNDVLVDNDPSSSTEWMRDAHTWPV